ncbi:hypothetical protein BGE01nite_48270 [Brevifollis gellanilyticus]|uniref:PIN domain-containing protein n=1 Tax=Brevifollis gellanilyticus TaxID=748831 RepID=A0A512MFQ8_9BACT|nr:hypothetical protein BGE01nite_48270 [Brevifollis gellanilyticus]
MLSVVGAENEKTKVVIDTNVFLDLSYPRREHHLKATGLTASWLDDILDLVVTPEIYNDIDRCEDDAQRKASRDLLLRYEMIRAPTAEVSELASRLAGIYPELAKTDRGRSDLKHIAYTVTAGVRFFVTRDELVLSLAPELLQSFDIQVLSPVELISMHDVIDRESEYQPQKLLGTKLVTSNLKASDIERVCDAFRDKANEKMHQFRSGLSELLTHPRRCSVRLVEQGGDPLLLAGIETADGGELIRMLRISGHSIAPTVARHILMNLIREGAFSAQELISLDDTHLSCDAVQALIELGFVATGKQWIKPLLHGFKPMEEISELLRSRGIYEGWRTPDELGTLIWPAKIDAESLPCYLVPIQAQWAEHFFDDELASLRLPGISDIRSELHLGVEGVYYSASRNKFSAPGHILWYVSLGCEDLGSMTVKAVSRLRSWVRDGPKQLFRQFQRLGVYSWKQVYQTANEDVNKKITALRFSHTERFRRPVTRSQLSALGIKGTFQGPMSVDHEAFKRIYELGTGATP